jgi:hypothetical protein
MRDSVDYYIDVSRVGNELQMTDAVKHVQSLFTITTDEYAIMQITFDRRITFLEHSSCELLLHISWRDFVHNYEGANYGLCHSER